MPRPTAFLGRVRGRNAIVTGAGSQGEVLGTGGAISILLAGEGAQVCVVDLDVSRAARTVAMIEEVGGSAFVATGNVSVEEDCRRVVQEAADRWGTIDILVNNVGIASDLTPVEEVDSADWDRVMDINLKSATFMTKHAIPHMIAQGKGSIVNITSVSGILSHRTLLYGCSKAAMIAFTREIAVSHGRKGIRANAVAPGHVFTSMIGGLIDERQQALRRKIAPMGIEGDAWDVAAAALFLVSDDARFITGICMPVDGGLTQIAPLTAHAFASEPDG